MEIIQEISNQYVLYIPVALVIFGAILVFAFGFKPPEQPPFDKLTNEDRKSAGKKRKTKEKKSTANGHISTGEAKHEKSPSKETKKSPAKEISEPKQDKKEKKLENTKNIEKNKKNDAIKNKTVEESKNKKNVKKATEKPVDFDDGNWETVPLKSDKKKKGDQSPAKKDKKPKKTNEKIEKTEIEKLVKDVVNKELREIENEIKEDEIIEKIAKKEEKLAIEEEEPVIIVEEKKEKKKEKKVKKEVVEKPLASVELIKNEKEIEMKDILKAEKPEEAENKTDVESEAPEKAAPAFDELGDIWTEAKVPKKSKKKARRDN